MLKMQGEKMIEVKNLKISAGGRIILDDANMTFEDGKIYVLVGKNGVGKTTFLTSIMGLHKPLSGRIFFNGTDISEMSVDERARLGISMAFQKPPSVDGVRLSDIFNDRKYAGLLNIPDEFFSRELNKGLSGGETKRTELFQVLSMNPKVALLDEPDSGVDIDSIKYIINAINELRKNGASVIVVTHNMEVIKRMGPDEIILMKNGKLDRVDSVENLVIS